jgi:hypothetical protein
VRGGGFMKCGLCGGGGDWIGVAHDADHRRTASKHGNEFVGTINDG